MKWERLTVPVEDRFWQKVLKGAADECWPWLGAKVSTRGYGCLNRSRRGGGMVLAHRLAWELHTGEAIPEGLLVCHSCDNPPCVNPAHLFLGTHKTNADDKMRKGRGPRGEAHGMSKLTEADVREIKRLRASGVRQVEVAARFGIGRVQVSRIENGHRWAHVS